MIISASRIRTSSGAGAVGSHVFTGAKNESIELVQGSRAELDDMVSDAREHGAKYAIRHLKVSPGEPLSREQFGELMRQTAAEFGFDPDRVVRIEHTKQRQGGKGFEKHEHWLVGEVDPVKGKVLSDKWMRLRHEKLARSAEVQFGHQKVAGKWNRAVERALRAEGKDDLADEVKPLVPGDDPRAAYSTSQHQRVERRGPMSMPAMKAAVAEAWQHSDGGRAFEQALADKGLKLRQGDKKGVWIVEAAGRDGEPMLVGGVARLVHAKSGEVADRLAREQQHQAITRSIAESRARTGALLAQAPHADPTSRNVREVAWTLREEIQVRLKAEEQTAGAARAKATEARGKVGIFGKIGLPTAARRQADRLAVTAEDAERQAELARAEYPREAKAADARAPHVARAREQERQAWERKPEIRDARREEHANDLIEQAVKKGDGDLAGLAACDLKQAQEETLRREREERQRLALEAACEPARAGQNLGGAGPKPPSPR